VTTHSIEGILVLVVVFVLGILVCIFYILWRYAEAKLKEYQSSIHTENTVSKEQNRE